jgi:CHASE2 domain-containing sensor protein
MGMKPPPGVPNSRVAFIDSAMNEKDSDLMVRRYMVHTDQRITSKSCQTDSSLATQAIQSYLPLQITEMPNGLEISTNSQSITLPRTSPNMGGYNSLMDLHGYQMLVRYKKNRIQQITLEELFSKDSELKNLIQDRIVLLGYSLGDEDHYLTPLGWKYGVEIHAQVISQILDQLTARSNLSALTNAPTTWLPGWLESVLIFSYSLIFGGLMYCVKSKFRWLLLPLAVILISGISIVSFSLSLWLPVVASLVVAGLAIVVIGISQILLRQSITEKS